MRPGKSRPSMRSKDSPFLEKAKELEHYCQDNKRSRKGRADFALEDFQRECWNALVQLVDLVEQATFRWDEHDKDQTTIDGELCQALDALHKKARSFNA